jgi:hypothetical protein
LGIAIKLSLKAVNRIETRQRNDSLYKLIAVQGTVLLDTINKLFGKKEKSTLMA